MDEIIEALERDIHPDNSKVVEGRLLALRADKSKLVEFSEKAEELADALRRSLVIEDISQAKAREMTIEKTVEVCRNAARSDLVKSVLASTKLIVESSREEKEKQVLAFRQFQKRNRYYTIIKTATILVMAITVAAEGTAEMAATATMAESIATATTPAKITEMLPRVATVTTIRMATVVTVATPWNAATITVMETPAMSITRKTATPPRYS